MSAELLARPLVGFRAWRVVDGLLRPLTGAGPEETWHSSPARAVCRGRAGLCEDALGCGCGLYADTRPVWRSGVPVVAGAVVAWGRIIEHRSGFRAEYARPLAFAEPAHHPLCSVAAVRRLYGVELGCDCRADSDLPAMVAERYGLPLLAVAELAAYMTWFGDPVTTVRAA